MGKKLSLKRKYKYFIALLSFLASAVFLALFFYVYFNQRFYPQTFINSFNVEGLTKEQAKEAISQNPIPEEITIKVNSPASEQSFKIPLQVIGASVDFTQTVDTAYTKSKSLGLRAFLSKKFYDFEVRYDSKLLDEQMSLVVTQMPSPPEEPSLVYSPSGIAINPGVSGYLLNQDRLRKSVIDNMRQGVWSVQISLEAYDPRLTPAEETVFLARGTALSKKTLKLVSPEREFVYDTQELIDFISPRTGYKYDSISPSIVDIKTTIKTAPQNPVFTFLPAQAGEEGRVKEFSPAKDGLEVNESQLIADITKALTDLENTDVDSVSVEIPLFKSPPDFKTEDVNNLGIKELIGVGTSEFRGSIPSRVHNIALAASRLNGVLIPPGEIFSFTKALGDISAYTGYQQAYIIQGNQTVLGDGGGVCQVSTTFFRAALNAGLPIIERNAHSYRVGYYEQDSPPGIDATIYSPTVDIKVKNDTPGNILIQTFTDTKKMTLRFELYGTSDGRVSTISKPVVSQVVPPPEDLYIDDPTLPTGQIKQVDYKAWGAKVNFNYKVERAGEIIFDETYFSNYRPWQAKFLRGTGPTQ